MKQTLIEFLSNPNKTAVTSLFSVAFGQGTEVIAQGTVTAPADNTSAIIQIAAYLAAIAAGIFSIANTLKCWYRDGKKNDEILK